MVSLRVWQVVCLCAVTACAKSESAQRDDVSLGDETFGSICAKCHGEGGSGGLPLTPGGPAPRNFTDHVWQDARTDAELEHTVREGKLPMPSFKTVLTADQIHAVIAKIRRLRKD